MIIFITNISIHEGKAPHCNIMDQNYKHFCKNQSYRYSIWPIAYLFSMYVSAFATTDCSTIMFQHILCTVHHARFSCHNIQSAVYIVYCVYCVLCILCTVYIVYCVILIPAKDLSVVDVRPGGAAVVAVQEVVRSQPPARWI